MPAPELPLAVLFIIELFTNCAAVTPGGPAPRPAP